MSWIGTWRNQYGSVVEITDEADHKITGTFRTALQDSGFFGQEISISGVHQGDCISFAGGGSTPAGDVVVSYTGLLREGRMETLWYAVADSVLTTPHEGAPAELKKRNWWRAMTTSADTFERVP
jgi:Avidin family